MNDLRQSLSVEQAIDAILGSLAPLAAEEVLLAEAHGRVLARDVQAAWDLPAFHNSAMDGFAVRHLDLAGELPVTLRVVDSAMAGAPAQATIGFSQAVRIATGAPLPGGADTVVPIELCEMAGAGEVRILRRPGTQPGAHVRHQGSYLARGERALEAGRRVGAGELALLASLGLSRVWATPVPRVAIVTTGDELVPLGQTPGPGQIVNSNAVMLQALVREAQARPVFTVHVPDTPEATREALWQAVEQADVVLTTGGVSVGPHDFVRDAMQAVTGGMQFWKVRVKPGKPLAYGLAQVDGRRVPIVGLPGNPASSFVGFHLFVRPALAVLQGQDRAQAVPPLVLARAAAPMAAAPGRRSYLAGTLQSTPQGLLFHPNADQSSGNAALFVGVRALAVIEADAPVGNGEALWLYPLGWF